MRTPLAWQREPPSGEHKRRSFRNWGCESEVNGVVDGGKVSVSACSGIDGCRGIRSDTGK
jgi:hypothetical protein